MGDATEALEQELAALKEQLLEWKGRYETIHEERLALERKLNDEVSPTPAAPGGKAEEEETAETPQPDRPRGRVAPPAVVGRDRVPSVSDEVLETPVPLTEAPARPPPRVAPPRPGSGTRVPVLDRSKKELKEWDPVEILSKKWLKKLYLFQNHLTTIPAEIAEFNELQALDLKYNRIKEWPTALCSVTTLAELLLAGNRVRSFPPAEDMAKLAALKKLDLSQNGLHEFPEALCSLPALADLALDRNYLEGLSPAIGHLTSLTRLSIKANSLKSLPEELCDLEYLQELCIADNQVTSLPEGLGKLVNLQKLDISENAITALPADVSGLTALQKLNAKRNKIDCIPESATVTETGGFYSLTELNLAHNQLESWSSALWTSEALQVVNLTANRLPEVPAEISYLYNLTHLHLNANRITVVANELGQLAALDTLELSFNDLEAVPADLGYLAALRVLSLGYNRLSGEALPDLSALSALEQLFLAGNPLQHVPAWVGSLPALSQLHLHLAELEELPEELCGLPSLQYLDVSGNKLSGLPAKLPELSGLQRLIACHNALETEGVPDGIDDLRELEEIDLSYNQLKTVPESVHYLKDRAHILLQGNPLDEETLRSYHTHTWTPSKRFKVSSAEIIGRRPTMEDALSLQGHFQGREDVDFFGLFDGHAGRGVAEYCADHVHTVVLDKLKGGSDTQAALKDCWVNVNSGLKAQLDGGDTSLRHAGATAVAAVVEGQRLIVSNVGDSRAVVGRAGKGIRISKDHKPNLHEEEERIFNLGGYVVGETARVNGQLAVSRAIGDFYLHPYVSFEPHVASLDLTPEDSVLIIACDGVWDEVDDDTVIELAAQVASADPFVISCRIRDYAYLLGSDDNISVITILLK